MLDSYILEFKILNLSLFDDVMVAVLNVFSGALSKLQFFSDFLQIYIQDSCILKFAIYSLSISKIGS